MRKLNKILLGLIGMVGLAFALNGCVKTPDCELRNEGTVIVKNSTGYSIVVDVTWGNSNYNYEKTISHGGSATYYNVPAGTVTVWGRYIFDSYWSYDDIYVSSCNTSRYTWYGKKSDEIIEINGSSGFIEIDDISNKTTK